MSNQERFTELVRKYINGTLTSEENNQLRQLLDDNRYEQQLDEILQESFQHSGDEQFWDDQQRQRFVDALGRRTVKPLRRTTSPWISYAAAAAVVIIFVGISLFQRDRPLNPTVTKTTATPKTDIPPGGDKAVLTLADGRKIVLDNAANGSLAQQGNAQIKKTASGQITYEGLAANEMLPNTLSTPVGGQFQLTLHDGTKVWLNAASSITFPAAFIGKERQVKITGEVYFEVAKDKQHPFIVDIDGKASVQVLGTSFNINSYANEGAIKTSLVEGSVKIMNGDKQALLQPGNQAIISPADQIQIQPANLDQTLAWKNGIFDFNGADLRSVMRQLERWYDIKVLYKNNVPQIDFEGKMYRNVNLSDVLDALQKMGVKFTLEGKTLVIL